MTTHHIWLSSMAVQGVNILNVIIEFKKKYRLRYIGSLKVLIHTNKHYIRNEETCNFISLFK